MVTPIHSSSIPASGGRVVSEKEWNKPFIELFIVICFFICFLTSFLSNPLLNTNLLNAGSAAFFVLWLAFRWGLPSQLLIHMACLIGSGLCLYLIAITGGTVSVVMVVFTGLAWLPFLLLPLKAAVAWLIAQFNALLVVFLSSQLGWISTQTNLIRETAYWNLSIKLQALAAMMLILDFLYRSRQHQINALQSRGNELEELHLELIRAQSHKDEFIASVGHELRTPMNAILGLNGVLRDEIHDNPQDLKRVELIRKSTQHLLSVVNDILDFSQLQADRMVLTPQPFHLRVESEHLFEKFKIRADFKQLKAEYIFASDLPDWILIDEKRFKQMLHSLLENALKFTHQGGITLRFLGCTLGLRIEVQDSGIGMTQEQDIFNELIEVKYR
jgi:signal transduction histidine kinase